METGVNIGDRHLDNILGKWILLLSLQEIIIESNRIGFITNALYFTLYSWFDYGRNPPYRLQCVLRERKIITCSRKSSIPYDTQFTRGARRYWNRGKFSMLFFALVYVNYVNFVPRKIPRNRRKQYGRAFMCAYTKTSNARRWFVYTNKVVAINFLLFLISCLLDRNISFIQYN